ncbi:MAG TPA: type II secretion system protein N [Rhodanobacter sp.]
MMRWRPSRRGIGTALAVLATYLLSLLMLAPAALLDTALQRASDGHLRLTEARGSLWTGAGRLEMRDAGGRALAGTAVEWTLRAPSVWRGRLDYALNIGHADKNFPVRLSLRGVEISDANFQLPAAALGAAAPQVALLGLQGELHVQLDRLVLADHDVQTLGAVVTWQRAGAAVAPVSPLGDYVLRLDRRAERLEASLRTTSGPLQLSGQGAWTHGSGPAMAVSAQVDEAQRQQLSSFLRLIAVERGGGKFELRLDQYTGGAAGSSSMAGGRP